MDIVDLDIEGFGYNERNKLEPMPPDRTGRGTEGYVDGDGEWAVKLCPITRVVRREVPAQTQAEAVVSLEQGCSFLKQRH